MANVVIITGNLTRDAAAKQTSNGKTYCNFTVASNKYVNGENQRTFVNCTAWGKQAEFVAKNFSKGSSIEVVGELHNNKRTIEGKEYTFTEVWTTSVSFGNGGAKKEKAEPQDDGFEPVGDNGDLPF